MKKIEEREARKLRSAGRSIKDIARTLRVSQGTVSRWCRNIRLSAAQKQYLDNRRRAAGRAALLPWVERNRARRQRDLIQQGALGKKDVGRLTDRDRQFLGLGLYWGEGYKRGSQECGFTNSDPEIIVAILDWLERCYGVRRERIIARLTLNTRYKSETARLIRLWSHETGIAARQFSKPTFIKGYGKPGGNPRTYRGTLRIKVRNGTSLRRRILAGIAEASRQI